MKIAVLSGKGGTGKTFVSVNLAAASPNAVYVDCDVEEPNGHLFFKPQIDATQSVTVQIPVVDESKCSGCRRCVDFCKFNALSYIRQRIMVFDDVCHSCGGCVVVCPENAISEKEKVIGKIEIGVSNNVKVMTGVLNTGEASGVPIIQQLIEQIPPEVTTIIDCPPGSACVVMESIKEADYCLLVAEPTLFGAHNLSMVYELVTLFHKPFGAVLNKCIEDESASGNENFSISENPSEVFCKQQHIPILEKIPFSKELGNLNSNALIATREKQAYQDLFHQLLLKVSKEVLA